MSLHVRIKDVNLVICKQTEIPSEIFFVVGDPVFEENLITVQIAMTFYRDTDGKKVIDFNEICRKAMGQRTSDLYLV